MRVQIRDLLNQIFTRLQKDKCGLHVWRASRSFSCQILNEHQYQSTNGTSELQQNGRLSVNNDLYFSLFLTNIVASNIKLTVWCFVLQNLSLCVAKKEKHTGLEQHEGENVQLWVN